MATLNSGLEGAYLPDGFGKLIDLEVDAKSVAFQISTVIDTNRHQVRVPLLVSDPAVAWTAEGATIGLSDPTTDEIVITPKKIAGRSQISNEAAMDSDPGVAELIGKGLARQIAHAVDTQFFYAGAPVANAPEGIGEVASVGVVDTAGGWTSLDPVHNAKAVAMAAGAELTHIVLAPDVALALAKAKQANGSNVGLFDSVEDGMKLAGLTALVSPAVAAGEAWAVDKSQVVVVRRTGTTLARSADAAFAEDSLQLRATSRISWGYANPAGIVRLVSGPLTYTLDFGGATGGTATVSVSGLGPSATIAYNAAASAVKTAIVGIDDGITADDVTVTGSAGVYTVTVPGTLSVNGASLTGGTAATATLV
ncbi:phage major capsid protein [Nocardia sp. NPDC050193]